MIPDAAFELHAPESLILAVDQIFHRFDGIGHLRVRKGTLHGEKALCFEALDLSVADMLQTVDWFGFSGRDVEIGVVRFASVLVFYCVFSHGRLSFFADSN